MSQPTRAKKSGKNTRSSPSVKQNQTTASRKPVPQPSGPQLFSLSSDFSHDAEPAKPKDIDLFTIRTQGAALDGVHISNAYTAPPAKLDVKPLKAARPDLQHTGTIPAYLLEPPVRLPDAHRPIPTGAMRETPQPQDVLRPFPARRSSDFEEDDLPQERPARRQARRQPSRGSDFEEDDLPQGRRQPSRRSDFEEDDLPQTHRQQERRQTARRSDFDEDDLPQARRQPSRKQSSRGQKTRRDDAPRKRKKRSTPPPPSREELARHREDAEIRRRMQHRKDRAAMKPVMAYMDGTKQLDVPDAKSRPSYANMPKKKPPYVPVKEGKGNTLAATIKEEREHRRKQEERLAYMIGGCVILFLIAAGFLIRIFLNYRRSADEYAGIQNDYVTHMQVAVANEADSEDPSSLQYPPLDINFASLYALNKDLVGWIYVPGCDISYPIVQGEDNDFYLTHTFLGTASSCGAIFMDYGDRASFTDFNTFVYGHNMQDGSMFGALHEYWQDETLAEREPYFYIYLRNSTVHKYRICSYYRDAGDSQSYVRVSTPEEKEVYVQMILQKSVLPESTSNETGAFIASAEDSYVTLSTCQGRIGSGQRFLIHGYLVGVY